MTHFFHQIGNLLEAEVDEKQECCRRHDRRLRSDQRRWTGFARKTRCDTSSRPPISIEVNSMFTQLDSRIPQMLKAVQAMSSASADKAGGKSTNTRR